MFGSKKLKMENEALKQELASLKDKYQTDVETLERQLKEAKQLLNTAQQRYESSDELMSSSLKGGDMLQTIRTAMVESAQSMAHENEELSSSKHIKHSHVWMTEP